ncbi:hypothetical protein CLAFUW4_14060 [Fulvia fulva]|uniref:Uncharacterized protein n=1 Tax=Passalora fulva TaxID=5499 RepID=A0A9Q8PLL3_PASFU|nr:uncharacterized protein CLAFUR5_13898 [Fulvia fulva]KAK4610693.1 hypothetical protein CLAFUR4_14063 [Fulvia fulva]KAK4611066.1 hypothetical protein CLAFUR0_14067 [Fulvia fulva]UJO24637.1 hypothetical protein CLAFUR5_13898 [Fulvia fulva]WPV22181.1 hypothetical protein CLAFUW4_14060 [Fulvia fulva]WPV37252.1 hypothetical protein CLAFUW7_14071 [Fulvia fulva]
MPDTRLWSILLCCLLSLQDFTVEAKGQEKHDIPLIGNGSVYASKCNAAKQSWVKASGSSFVSETTFNSTYEIRASSTVYTTLTYLSNNATAATPYTLCDGYPRINGSRTVTSSYVPYTVTSTTLETTSVFSTLPAPNCTINSSDCAQLKQAYETENARYSSFISASPAAYTAPPSATSPICGPATLTSFSSAVDDGVCVMNKASVQLLYWPVTVPSSCDSCHRSDCPTTTPAPSVSGKVNTAVWHNITLTSPTVYIAFEGSWSFTSDGKDYTEPAQLVIPQSAHAVSSLCGKPGGGYGPPQKVNYANFNSPVPADVYRCQPSCYRSPPPYPPVPYTAAQTYTYPNMTSIMTGTGTTYLSIAPTNLCSTIWDDYSPVLSIPEAFKTIRPAGYVDFLGQDSICQFVFDEDAVLFDPPIALTEAQSVVKPTLPADNPAQPTAADTYTTLPAETGQPNKPTPPQNPATPGGYTPPVQPTPPPGGGRLEQTATKLNVGGYIATGLGLTIPNNGGQNSGGPNDGGQNNGDVTIAVAPGGQGLVINGATTTLDAHSPGRTGSGGSSESAEVGVITIAGQPRTFIKQGSQVIIDGQTINPGGSAVVGGQTVTLGSDGSHVVVGSDGSHVVVGSSSGQTTVELKPTGTASISGGDRTGYITAAGSTLAYSVIDGTTLIDGKTLKPDSAVTLTSARSSHSTTKMSNSQTTSTEDRPTSTTSTGAVVSMLNISDWRCQIVLMLGFMALLAGM